MSYEELKIGKLVQTVLKPLIIDKATMYEVMQMQELEYSKSTFGIQYPLLLKTASSVAEKHYYSDLFTLYGETYRLCCEWFETATNNDRPYVEKWILEHEDYAPEEVSTQSGIAIGSGQYKGRNDLTSIVIPYGVVYIGQKAFDRCLNLREIVLPDSVEVIDDFAFEVCRKLEKIQLPENLRWIGRGAFALCDSLQYINIPRKINIIPKSCFYHCINLKTVEGFENVDVIMHNAFVDCESLSSSSLYNLSHVSIIKEDAFRGCNNFELTSAVEIE